MAVRIVTDSTADIPSEVREALGIEIVPLKVHFGEESFQDAVSIGHNEFYERLIASDALPTTSQPSPVEFVDVYKKLLQEPDSEVISIHLSSKFSGTYQSALLAKSMIEDAERVTVVDSLSASYGYGMLAVEAAKAAQGGADKAEIMRLIEELRRDMRIYFFVGTLDYLYKGGRIGKASALFGSLLSIKPILTIDENGEVAVVDKIRGTQKALQRIIELLEQDFGAGPIDISIAYAHSQDISDQLAAMVKERFDIHSFTNTFIGPVIGTHVGPGTAAVFVVPAR